MSDARWAEIERVLLDALDVAPSSRAAFLDRACEGRADVRARVEALLAAHDDSDGFLESPTRAPEAIDPIVTLPEGTRLGAHRLVREIGRGGMGVVYLAERDDQQFDQQVAVKVVSARGSAALLRRFREERQILANLQHPHIARLLDAGVAPDGSPFLVMDYVEGKPIDAYCAQRHLPARERARIFQVVCDAVQFAHQQLIVHRDLKPANILVSAEGHVTLLDFGIAKMLAGGADAPVDQTVLHPMTPHYASPEQVRGGTIGTSSDVYSLGVLLHELLVGRRPYELAGRPFGEIVEIVCDRDVAAAGTGSADLDAIIAMALRKAPADRYPSADALAADLGRYLAGEPVHARRGTRLYVATRFLARHRVAVSALALALVLATAAMAVIVRQSRMAARRFDEVRSLAGFVIFDIHDAIAPLAGSTPARKLLVSRALQYLDAVRPDAVGNEPLELEISVGYLRLGDVLGLQSQANLGDPEGAIASYEKARELLSRVVAREPANPRAAEQLINAHLRLSATNMFLRRIEPATAEAGHAVTLAEAFAARAPGDPAEQVLGRAYHAMADVRRARDDGEGSRAYWEKEIGTFESLLARRPDDPERQRNAALGHKYLGGQLLSVASAADAAATHLARAQELDALRAGARPQDREAQMDLSFDYSQNATLAHNRGDYAAAEAAFREAIRIRAALAASDPRDVRMQDRLAFAHRRLGRTLLARGDAAGALHESGEAVRIAEALVAADAKSLPYRTGVAWAHVGVAEAAWTLADLPGDRRPDGATRRALTQRACAASARAAAIFDDNVTRGVGGADERAQGDALASRLRACPAWPAHE